MANLYLDRERQLVGDAPPGRRTPTARAARSGPLPQRLDEQPGDRHRGRQQRHRRAVARRDAGRLRRRCGGAVPTTTASTPSHVYAPLRVGAGAARSTRPARAASAPSTQHTAGTWTASGPPSTPAAAVRRCRRRRRHRSRRPRSRAGSAGGATYVVQPNDSWWSIAAATIGDPARDLAGLAAANGGAAAHAAPRRRALDPRTARRPPAPPTARPAACRRSPATPRWATAGRSCWRGSWR